MVYWKFHIVFHCLAFLCLLPRKRVQCLGRVELGRCFFEMEMKYVARELSIFVLFVSSWYDQLRNNLHSHRFWWWCGFPTVKATPLLRKQAILRIGDQFSCWIEFPLNLDGIPRKWVWRKALSLWIYATQIWVVNELNVPYAVYCFLLPIGRTTHH